MHLHEKGNAQEERISKVHPAERKRVLRKLDW
jgi:hypothetical protein